MFQLEPQILNTFHDFCLMPDESNVHFVKVFDGHRRHCVHVGISRRIEAFSVLSHFYVDQPVIDRVVPNVLGTSHELWVRRLTHGDVLWMMVHVVIIVETGTYQLTLGLNLVQTAVVTTATIRLINLKRKFIQKLKQLQIFTYALFTI